MISDDAESKFAPSSADPYIIEKEGEVLALSHDLSAKEQTCKALQDSIERERRVAAENIVITAGEKEGIDAVFDEIPSNGTDVTKFARDGGAVAVGESPGDYITTSSSRYLDARRLSSPSSCIRH